MRRRIMAASEGWNMPTGELMKGKKGLIMGVANANSIAWGIASQLAAQGAELAFTYLGEGLERRVRPLAESVGARLLIQADVTDDASMDAAFAELEKEFGTIDFVVHSVAFANKDELKGSFVENTSRDSFLLAMNISAFSFVDVAKRASKLMPNGGSMITMTYLGSERAIPNYNTMGVAKAALEAATRYIARDLGPKGIRVNAISAGAMRTLSLAGISGGRGMISQGRAMSAMKEDTSMEGVAGAALWLCSDLGLSTTGEVVHVDAGFHMMGLAGDEE
ncbi:MAG: enoyl-ACP reductase [Caulobacterales bacterium GWE1_67_11]|nr:MAG: enoyl-ACP reductase [Caulobacterales bacterium GWE1_67_11]OGN46511.1 MAG: enoyl-ACP reductase [Caulobacterales bacterium RIFCSPHIGHO2_12_FULL_68_13]OGN47700.1 MAG: enoyl-ACP reductase [Caulobacterales bacterium RIFCSPHIGHO2_01_FULL_67_30]